MGLQFKTEKGGIVLENAYAKIVQFAGTSETLEIKTHVWGSLEARRQNPDDMLMERLDVVSFKPQKVWNEEKQDFEEVPDPIIQDPSTLFAWLYFKLKNLEYFDGAFDV